MALARLAILLSLGLLITVAGTLWPNIAFTKGYQFDWSPIKDALIGVGYYTITLVGILSSILFAKLEARGDEIVSIETLRSILMGSAGVRAVLVSPLIFIFVLNAFGKDANNVMTFAFAYQNGFFWQQVLQKLALVR